MRFPLAPISVEVPMVDRPVRGSDTANATFILSQLYGYLGVLDMPSVELCAMYSFDCPLDGAGSPSQMRRPLPSVGICGSPLVKTLSSYDDVGYQVIEKRNDGTASAPWIINEDMQRKISTQERIGSRFAAAGRACNSSGFTEGRGIPLQAQFTERATDDVASCSLRDSLANHVFITEQERMHYQSTFINAPLPEMEYEEYVGMLLGVNNGPVFSSEGSTTLSSPADIHNLDTTYHFTGAEELVFSGYSGCEYTGGGSQR